MKINLRHIKSTFLLIGFKRFIWVGSLSLILVYVTVPSQLLANQEAKGVVPSPTKKISDQFGSNENQHQDEERREIVRKSKDPGVVLDNADPETLAKLFGNIPIGYVEALPPGSPVNQFLVRIDVNLSVPNGQQHLTVTSPSGTFVTKVSGGRRTFSDILKGKCHTVNGIYKTAFSQKYGNAEMPYPVFFQGRNEKQLLVYAIHGTKATDQLGSPASHGCIRTETEAAKKIQEIIKVNGGSESTVICVH